MADVLINGCPISWRFIGKVRKKCGGDKLTTIECFWRARHCKTATEIMKYIQAGFRVPKSSRTGRTSQTGPTESNAWGKPTTIPYNFSPTKERMQRGGKEMIARWWQTCTGPPFSVIHSIPDKAFRGKTAPVEFNIEDFVKLKDINQILNDKERA